MAKRAQARRSKPRQGQAKRGTATAKRRTKTARRTTPQSTTSRSTAGRSAKKPAIRRATPTRSARNLGALSAGQGVPVDALNMLAQDHREVEALFSQFKTLEGAREKAAMAAKICLLLKVHAQIEEEILYPAARDVVDEENLVDEAQVEHGSARKLIAQIEAMRPRDHLFAARVNVLREYVRHHVKEEENELFPALRDKGLDVYELGAQLAARKVALLVKLTGKN